MIEIRDKKDCCGCSACVQKCPKQCISLKEDEEGFLYPVVEIETCIDCGLCEKVCPVLHQGEERKPLKIYAAKNQNEEIRKQSSSGGVFTLLAEEVIKEGGVVFGARFDEEWEVKHDFTETMEGLGAFRGSKYVQSRIEDNFQKVEAFLKQGRKVLFSGTPCQVAGLKRFLRKEYDNLLTVDFVCHGVPSPGVWRRYLKETKLNIYKNKRNVDIENISFRDKQIGWKKYCFSLKYSELGVDGEKKTNAYVELARNNIYMKGFLADLYLRPSCYACPAKCGKSDSDITIGDLWGAPFILGQDDDKGTSLVFINEDISYLKNNLSLWAKEIDYSSVLVYNPSIVHSIKKSVKRHLFYTKLKKTESLNSIIDTLSGNNIYYRVIFKLERIVKQVFGR